MPAMVMRECRNGYEGICGSLDLWTGHGRIRFLLNSDSDSIPITLRIRFGSEAKVASVHLVVELKVVEAGEVGVENNDCSLQKAGNQKNDKGEDRFSTPWCKTKTKMEA